MARLFMTGGPGHSPTKALSGIVIILGGLIAAFQASVFVLANDWNGLILVGVADRRLSEVARDGDL